MNTSSPADPGRKPGEHRSIRVVFLALAVLAILVATLHSAGAIPPRSWSLSLASGPSAAAELIQNLLLFIPLGVALILAGVRPLWAVAIGFGLSFGVEFAQHWIPGRDQSLGDILCNTISTGIGAGLAASAPKWLFVSPRRAVWQAVALAIVAAGVWAITGWLLMHPRVATSLTLEQFPHGRHTIGEGWQVIFYPDAFHRFLPLINAAWLGGWMLGVGFWGQRGGNWWPISIGLVAAGVLLSLLGLRSTPVGEWAGAMGGAGIGIWLGVSRGNDTRP